MIRNVRNSWIDLNVDGRSTSINTGPRNRHGGMRACIKVRDTGQVRNALQVEQFVTPEGRIDLRVWELNPDGAEGTSRLIYSREFPR